MKKNTLIILLCITVSFCFSQDLKREYITSRTYDAPSIDGEINDPCWETANIAGEFQMNSPYDDRPASFDTEFKILYDNNNLYLAIRAYDPEPQKIYRQVTRRDNVNSEYIAVYIDSYNDNSTAFCFMVNASGVLKDIFISKDGSSWDASWNAIWWAKTNIDEQGWTAEFRIPLSQLRFVNSDEQQWGLNIRRSIQRKDENSYWTPLPQDAQGFVHRFGLLSGLKNIKARKVFDITPYSLASLNTYEAEASNPYRDGSNLNFNFGFDGKIGLSNNFTMDYTVNPDFGQVEADPASVNLSAYETFFSEQRPFFIEGSNITNFSLDVDGGTPQLFYSRRIGGRPHFSPSLDDDEYAKIPNATSILAAAKITGRTDAGLNIGIVETITQKEFAEINSSGTVSESSIEPLSNYATVALRQDLNKGNTKLGGIITAVNRQLNEEHLTELHKQAYSYGLDFSHSDNAHRWKINARTYGSYVQGSKEAISNTQLSSSHLFQRPDADWVTYDSTRTSLAGYGGSASIGQYAGKFQSSIKFNWRSPSLELNDIGYIGETDDITENIWMRYRISEPLGIFRSFNVSALQWNSLNYGGMYINSGINLNSNSQFKNFMRFNISYTYYGKLLSSTALRGGPRFIQPSFWNLWMWLGSNSLNDLQGSVYAGFDGNEKETKHSLNLSGNINWKVSDFFNVAFNLNWNIYDDALQYVGEQDYYGDSHYILATIQRETFSSYLAVNVNLTPQISLEYRLRPYFTSAKYEDFKRVIDGENANLNDRFDIFTSDNINLEDGSYYCDPDRNNSWDYSFGNPDFVYNSIQSNLVFRWEYLPGSTLFLVWSLNNSIGSGDNHLVLTENILALQDEIPENIFLVKVSYRLGR